MRFHDRLRRKARQNKAVITDDPEGLIALLQVAKRLLTEAASKDEKLSIYGALHNAIPMSAPKDPVRVWWKAVRVILLHGSTEKSSIDILTAAIEAQGRTNLFAKKGPKP